MPHKNKEEKSVYHIDYYNKQKTGEIRTWENTPVDDLSGRKFNSLVALSFSYRREPLGRAMWSFRCDCGKTKVLSAADVIIGKQKTCGCRINCTKRVRKSVPEEAARHNKFAQYRYDAKNRGLEWSLTEEEFNTLSTSDCAVCGIEPLQIHTLKRKKGFDSCLYNGIDRIDNSKGYVANNVRPCCKHCNLAKHTMSEDEFNSWISRIIEFHSLKETVPNQSEEN
jgi:hypothetical protein